MVKKLLLALLDLQSWLLARCARLDVARCSCAITFSSFQRPLSSLPGSGTHVLASPIQASRTVKKLAHAAATTETAVVTVAAVRITAALA